MNNFLKIAVEAWLFNNSQGDLRTRLSQGSDCELPRYLRLAFQHEIQRGIGDCRGSTRYPLTLPPCSHGSGASIPVWDPLEVHLSCHGSLPKVSWV